MRNIWYSWKIWWKVRVEGSRRRQVASERLLDHDPVAALVALPREQAGGAQATHGGRERARA